MDMDPCNKRLQDNRVLHAPKQNCYLHADNETQMRSETECQTLHLFYPCEESEHTLIATNLPYDYGRWPCTQETCQFLIPLIYPQPSCSPVYPRIQTASKPTWKNSKEEPDQKNFEHRQDYHE